MLLSGAVSVQDKKPLIEEWDWIKAVHNALLHLKAERFDFKVRKAMETGQDRKEPPETAIEDSELEEDLEEVDEP